MSQLHIYLQNTYIKKGQTINRSKLFDILSNEYPYEITIKNEKFDNISLYIYSKLYSNLPIFKNRLKKIKPQLFKKMIKSIKNLKFP